ncbi:MAG: ATP-binding protein [Rhodospirillaceae bacterium]
MKKIRITIHNRLEDVTRVADALDTFAAQHGLSRLVTHDLHVCLDEALSNILKFAYTDRAAHEITVELALGDGLVRAEVMDDGLPFDPRGVPPYHPGNRLAGGLGVYFIRKLMDDVAYTRIGRHNHLVMVKKTAMGSALRGNG